MSLRTGPAGGEPRRRHLTLAVLAGAALLLLTLDHRGAIGFDGLRSLAAAVYGPVEGLSLPAPDARVETLERENAALWAQLVAAGVTKADAGAAGRLHAGADGGGYGVVTARVVGAGGPRGFELGGGYEDTVTISAGSAQGVAPGMTVLDAAGIVGRVTETGPSSSTVLLVTDASAATGVRVSESGEMGVATGRTEDDLLSVRLLNSRAELKKGQRLVTLGSVDMKPYIAGVPLGVVTSVEHPPGALTASALVKPFARFTALDLVAVVTKLPGPPQQARPAKTPKTPKSQAAKP